MAEDRTPLGVVEEVFGPVTQPLYAFRWDPGAFGGNGDRNGKGDRCGGGSSRHKAEPAQRVLCNSTVGRHHVDVERVRRASLYAICIILGVMLG